MTGYLTVSPYSGGISTEVCEVCGFFQWYENILCPVFHGVISSADRDAVENK